MTWNSGGKHSHSRGNPHAWFLLVHPPYVAMTNTMRHEYQLRNDACFLWIIKETTWCRSSYGWFGRETTAIRILCQHIESNYRSPQFWWHWQSSGQTQHRHRTRSISTQTILSRTTTRHRSRLTAKTGNKLLDSRDFMLSSLGRHNAFQRTIVILAVSSNVFARTNDS